MRRRRLRDREELEQELRDVALALANERNVRLQMYLDGARAALNWVLTTSGDPIQPTRMVHLVHVATAEPLPFTHREGDVREND
jgi:hypothetical protein